MIGELLGRLVFLALFPFMVMPIVGGVYYLSARPQLTFRQAMFRWWVVAIGFAFLLLGICGQFVRNI